MLFEDRQRVVRHLSWTREIAYAERKAKMAQLEKKWDGREEEDDEDDDDETWEMMLRQPFSRAAFVRHIARHQSRPMACKAGIVDLGAILPSMYSVIPLTGKNHAARPVTGKRGPSSPKPPKPKMTGKPAAFLDLPRELHDKIYECALQQYPRQLYRFNATIQCEDPQMKRIVVNYEDGIVAVDVSKERYGKKFQFDSGWRHASIYRGLEETSARELDYWAYEQIWATPDWRHERSHPELDVEFQARTDFLIQHDVMPLKVSGLNSSSTSPATLRDAAVRLCVVMAAWNPFLLRLPMRGRTKEVPIVLFYAGDVSKRLEAQDNYYANAGLEFDGTQYYSDDDDDDERDEKDRFLQVSKIWNPKHDPKSSAATRINPLVCKPVPEWPFKSPRTSYITRNCRKIGEIIKWYPKGTC